MKRFFSIFGLLFVMVFSAPDADARKFGGGKSFGKSFKTAPAPKSQPANTDTIGKQNAPAAAGKSSSKSMLGGLFGGLLVGGLIASIFGGSFDGFQIMDFLLIAVIAFVLFKIFKGLIAAKNSTINQKKQGAFAGGVDNNKAYYRQPSSQEAASASSPMANVENTPQDVPFTFTDDFDQSAFVKGACDHYRILQQAWNTNQFETMLEYLTPELYNELANERRQLTGEQHTEVMYVDAQIVRADTDANRAQLSVQFTGRYRDSHEGVEEDITDIWHLERNLLQHNSPWLIVGIKA